MKKLDKKTFLIAAGTLLIGFIAGWIIFGGTKNDITANQEQINKVDAKTVWTCSMHPQIRRDEPGDCPICGMDLIPLNDESEIDTDPNAITMSVSAIRLANVSTAFVGKSDPVKQIQLNGKVQADERLVFSQSSHINGRIEKLLVNFTGEYISKGQVIATIYSPELVTAQEELFEALKVIETQPQLYNAAKEKLKNWKLSDEQINEILKSGKIQEHFPVKAEISGFVTEKKVDQGDYLSKGEVIYKVADLSRVWIVFDVYESDMIWIKKGNKVKFTVASVPGENLEGKIFYIDPVIDPKTRVAKARIEYINTNGKLKPEMFVSGLAEVELTNKSGSLVVPKSAVMWTGKRSVVYVKTSSEQGGSYVMREVTLGPALGDSYIVERGLDEGEEIVVNGTFSVDAAAQLAGKPSMMNPGIESSTSEHKHENMDMSDKAEVTVKKDGEHAILNPQAVKELNPVYSDYLKLKDALVNDNIGEAKKHASSMKNNIGKVNMELFNGDFHIKWMKYGSEISVLLEKILDYSDIEDVREDFRQVSAHMIQMSQTLPFGKTLYVQHCPMANGNKGADWLSLEKEIKNPYFGASMLTCGEVTKEIK